MGENKNENKINKSGVSYLVRVFIQLLIQLSVFLIAAGTFHISNRIWCYFAVLAGCTVISAIILIKYNPETLNERIKNVEKTKSWDKVLVNIYVIMGFYGVHIVAGLDTTRFKWSELSINYMYGGLILYIASTVIVAWAMLENKHFEATARIQDNRKHQVIASGPYAVVRHPGYSAIVLWAISIPFVLGSLYTFIPAGIVIITMFIRTYLEDNMLKKELKGYQQYAKKVKSRLIPGIW